jgi:adenine-specific DNA-methyltransferase
MPTLQFKGKNIIWNHHLAVPFHTLDEVPELNHQSEKANGNMIIEGDNLIVLKALLPQFAGRINAIYIDPPYNTGNEGWIFNDKVNSPLIKDWIGKEVSKDDLTRHDKWLCMMVPRLKLLFQLLSESGVIFISIDDNELSNLISFCNEIFGEENLIGILPRITKKAGKTSDNISKNTDYIVIYKRVGNLEFEKIEIDDEGYKHSDEYEEERGKYKLSQTLDYSSIQYSASLDYEIELEGEIFRPGNSTKEEMEGRIIRNPKSDWCWRWSKPLFEFGLEKGFIVIKESRSGKRIYTKTYSNATIENTGSGYQIKLIERKKNATTLEFIDNQYSNDNSRKEIEKIFGYKAFDYSKPSVLIKKIMELASDKNSIILDSYAGSGSTMHAVMQLNKEDGGNRKCIMVQMPENSEAELDKNICKDITRERVKRAIDKFNLDSGFKYYRLGIPLDAETMLAGQLPTYNQFAKYVYYLCTGENLESEDKINEANFYVGEYGKQAIYLVYKQDYETLTRLALNLKLAEKIKEQQPGKKRIVYAPSCFLDEEYLTDNQIEYVGIPYNLFQRNQ